MLVNSLGPADAMLKLLGQGKQVQKWENIDLDRLLAAKGLREFFDVEEWPAVNAVRELATRVKKAAEAMASGSDKPAKPFVFTSLKQCALTGRIRRAEPCICLSRFLPTCMQDHVNVVINDSEKLKPVEMGKKLDFTSWLIAFDRCCFTCAPSLALPATA